MGVLILNKSFRKIKKNALLCVEDTIKILVRCKKMYEAKGIVVSILRLIGEREKEGKASPRQRLSGRLLSLIESLQEEHRVFKRPFIVNGLDYLAVLKQEYERLSEEMEKRVQI